VLNEGCNCLQVLISTSTFNLNNFVGLDDLKKAKIEVRLNPHGKRLTRDQVLELLDDKTVGLIAGLEQLSAEVLKPAKSLKVIARVGTGLDSIDLVAAKKLGIEVLNTPDAPTSAVAELTLAHILGILRNVGSTDRQIRLGNWQGQMGSLLATKTVGVVGFGRIGRQVAKLLSSFGSKVVVCETNLKVTDFEVCALDDLCRRADVLTLHLPYDESTHHLIGEKQIKMMKPGSFVVNVARGGLIDEAALLKALETGHLAGAALDCFEVEPYSGPLSKLDNVQMTAHMGTYARETRDLMEQEASRLLMDCLRKLAMVK